MYDLIIDGKTVRSEEFLQPLVEELRYYAQSAGFEVATIVRLEPEPTPKTPEEKIAFRKDWDRRVTEGRASETLD